MTRRRGASTRRRARCLRLETCPAWPSSGTDAARGPCRHGRTCPLTVRLSRQSRSCSRGPPRLLSESLMFPSVPAGAVQIPRITDGGAGWTRAGEGCGGGVTGDRGDGNARQSRLAGADCSVQFEVRVEDLAIWPALERCARRDRCRGRISNELDEQTFNGAAGELNGLFVAGGERGNAATRGRDLHVRHRRGSRRWWTASTPTPSRTFAPSSALQDVRALRRHLRKLEQGRHEPVRLPPVEARLDSRE